MAAVAGFNALVYAKATSAAPSAADLIDGIKDASLSLPADMLETTKFLASGAGYKTRILGLQDSSADVSGDFIAGDAVQSLIRSSKSSGATVYFTFIGDPSASAGSQGFRVPMIVSEFDLKASPSGLVAWSAKLVGNGAIVAV